MAMTDEQLLELVNISIDGEINHHSIDQFCQKYPDITIEEGYRGQRMRAERMETMGHRIVGYKLGGTSMAKVNQLKSSIYSNAAAVSQATQVIYGRLMEYMQLGADEDLQFLRCLHPKVEPEFAFVMGEDLEGDFVSATDVIWATEAVLPAFEVIDSRFHHFKIGRRPDALIDNTSSGFFKLGHGGVNPKSFDLNMAGMKLSVNGEFTGFGAGASILGHPARAVAILVQALAKEKTGLKKGDIVLSGAVTASTPVKTGDVLRADFGGIGYVELTVV